LQHSAQYTPLDSGLPQRWHNGGRILLIFLEQFVQTKPPTLPHPMHSRGKKKSVTSCRSCFNQPVKTKTPSSDPPLFRLSLLSVTAQSVACAAEDRLVQIDVAVPDFQVEPAFRICANPGFIMYRCPLAAEIGQRNQITYFAF
ncbi:MAG: hypothetical protein NT177_06595, partial [Chloroflexi bacterium]|nr:hypothetical protein [Chloroflexota bacterium]